MIEDYEKLGIFYLGKKYNMESKSIEDQLVLYESKDLLTHAVCVGMTGSGKTGLCMVLLEEAIIDGIPLLIVDPKGDISNLLLTFPQLNAENFLPWINEQDALKKGLSLEEYAKNQAETWKKGISDWNQLEERIGRLRNSANFIIYTPGSNSGIPLSILKSFSSPSKEVVEDSELFRERIDNTVISLLTIAGIKANPQSREHILISTILNNVWSAGKDFDLAGLIKAILEPPMTKVGVLDIESFFPSKDRFGLVMSLNNLLASPTFSSWMEGVDLDIGNILYDKSGKPNVSIFSISHLNDNERMFFVTLLLNQILSWVRAQSGTMSLRSILYFDEIYGYVPPIANPPSKQPLMTLLKQARAFGLGIVLATQNPVDLDYKGLSNTGTWFIGRLQTEQDRDRVLDGLVGVSQNGNKTVNRKNIEQLISGLDNRIFLMNNTHEDGLEMLQTRWALSYLRGPLVKDQIKQLMAHMKKSKDFIETKTKSEDLDEPIVSNNDPNNDHTNINSKSKNEIKEQPILSPEITQYFIPLSFLGTKKPNEFFYKPVILGAVSLNFIDSKLAVDLIKDLTFITPITDGSVPVDWANSQQIEIDIKNLQKNPENANFMDLPPEASKPANYESWKKDFIDWLYRNQKLNLFKVKNLKEISKVEESERDFKIRIDILIRENRDNMTQKLRQKYASKMRSLQEKIQRTENILRLQQEQAQQQKIQTAFSLGSTLIGAFMGRKIARYTARRASDVMRGVTRTAKEKNDVDKTLQILQSYQRQFLDLETEFKAEVVEIENKIRRNLNDLETITLKLDKKDISVKLLSLTWVPTSNNTT
jgi:Helicase HerA, central domain